MDFYPQPAPVNASLYHYTGNNPVKYTDPDGKSAIDIVSGVLVTDLSIPEPYDSVLIKWGAYVFAFGVASCINYLFINFLSEVDKNSKENTKQEEGDHSASIPDDPSKTGHIFDPSKPGHLPEDTPENRKKLEDVGSDEDSYKGKDQWGNDWHVKTNEDGTQTWVESRDGKIWDGGVNKEPLPWDPKTGLKNLDLPR